ncbi:MAG: GNAT family N-acetyltransferase [Crocinitomicaceae bacterium]|nr:GNAT family N-acetyltransferase [Crocinitomicaceae bacterium]
MRTPITTERLILREIESSDAEDLFEMDSKIEVMKYIGIPPLKKIEEVYPMINMLQEQYKENGIGRWAVELKSTGEVIGWSGLKLHDEEIDGNINFYELGYRFKPQHWAKGYATESSKAWMDYAFHKIETDNVFGMTDPRHKNSKKVLMKMGFEYVKQVEFYNETVDWFVCNKTKYLNQ